MMVEQWCRGERSCNEVVFALIGSFWFLLVFGSFAVVVTGGFSIVVMAGGGW